MYRLTRILLPLFLLALAGCGTATPPTPTPTPPPTATPTPTARPTATPVPPTSTLAATITVVAPSSFGGSPLQAYIAYADRDLCGGEVPREMIVNAERAADLATKVACLKRLIEWEMAAGEQQRTLYQRGTCDVQPGSDTRQRGIRISEIWALDDLAHGYIIAGGALAGAGEAALAREAYETVRDYYACAWMFDLATTTYTSAVAAAEVGLAGLDGDG